MREGVKKFDRHGNELDDDEPLGDGGYVRGLLTKQALELQAQFDAQRVRLS
jgi:hypothetical protein